MVLHAGFLMMLFVLLFVSIVHNYNKYSAIVYRFFSLFNRVAYLLCLAVLLSLFMGFHRILGHSVTKDPIQDDVIFASWIVNVLSTTLWAEIRLFFFLKTRLKRLQTNTHVWVCDIDGFGFRTKPLPSYVITAEQSAQFWR